jgi:hypothetical protein
MGIAWLKARGFKGVVVSHDTDILNYSRDLLWRLCYPLLHPRMGYRFAKGYYSRVSDRLFGRVTRLLIFPLIQACRDVLGAKPLIEQLESYRYPLSGEFAADMDALRLQPARWLGFGDRDCCARPSVTCRESISVRWISVSTSSTATAASRMRRSA